jgi:hypothetical protein
MRLLALLDHLIPDCSHGLSAIAGGPVAPELLRFTHSAWPASRGASRAGRRPPPIVGKREWRRDGDRLAMIGHVIHIRRAGDGFEVISAWHGAERCYYWGTLDGAKLQGKWLAEEIEAFEAGEAANG